eukprot:TRINITY_DN7339_c0_g1_i5.p1 TRINITY_DN7339_c0_g1~~TRINITY_DN7339_c0_g1_i5.p1  ORF type:complete len:129 (-),score=11.24 TRINITY_DN7339_c0_g1_i5:1030-1416(-)
MKTLKPQCHSRLLWRSILALPCAMDALLNVSDSMERPLAGVAPPAGDCARSERCDGDAMMPCGCRSRCAQITSARARVDIRVEVEVMCGRLRAQRALRRRSHDAVRLHYGEGVRQGLVLGAGLEVYQG